MTLIEAVPERLDIKRAVLGTAAAAAPGALLASNTSSLSIADIAAGLPDPSRVVGMHFFNPVPAMKLCEVVHHAGSSPESVAQARAVAERMGKTAVVVRDASGFASSRLGIALGMEAIRMVEEEVASPADIDAAMKLGDGHPMAPSSSPTWSASTSASPSPSTYVTPRPALHPTHAAPPHGRGRLAGRQVRPRLLPVEGRQAPGLTAQRSLTSWYDQPGSLTRGEARPSATS